MLILFVKKLEILTVIDWRLNFFILIIILVEVILKFILNPRSIASVLDLLMKHGTVEAMWIITKQNRFSSRVYTRGKDRDCPQALDPKATGTAWADSSADSDPSGYYSRHHHQVSQPSWGFNNVQIWKRDSYFTGNSQHPFFSLQQIPSKHFHNYWFTQGSVLGRNSQGRHLEYLHR